MEFFILWKLCVGMEPAHFVASSKGINLLKDINNYLYFHYKDKAYNTQARITETDAKSVAVLQKESNEQVSIATYLESNRFMIATKDRF